MFKILAVFGATGQQGSSIVDYVLNDSELSRQYKIRAITRNVTSEKAKQLKDQVEVVYGDILNRSSLETALTGVHTVFIMTAPFLSPHVEYDTVKTIADIALEKDAKYVIFSTLPSIHELSGGKYMKVTLFDIKAKAEQYIRGLPIQSAFCSLGSFMENFESTSFLTPRKEEDGTWVVALHVSPNIQWPLVNAVKDTGKFVGAILAEPDKFDGKTFCGATKLYSLEEIIAIMSKATGKDIIYKRLSTEELKKRMKLPDELVDMFMEMIASLDENGYFGPDSEELVAWAANNARGKLSTFEEYLEAHPLRLE
ncbi:putative hscarg dehydrogenase [Dendryphion nanum]|uniref:Hscarg dehydrogenase n=1 Tax=Dendryphion nanum TaxID=256645 RepID=A0A9P9IKI8_9PLEO|nr:putative hscarg dehydrogenase [Dendryphion nanum]